MMKTKELKSYDITLFEVEQEYNKQIVPIQKKIDRLNSQHETKSLAAHKDFLAKEKKSKANITTLNDKNVVRFQRIERAVENKLVKLKNKKQRLLGKLDAFKQEQEELRNQELALLSERVEELKNEEQSKKDEIHKKYTLNIESYVEKLDIYNNNFDKNKEFHKEEIERYQKLLDKQIKEIEDFHVSVLDSISERLQKYALDKAENDNEITRHKQENNRLINNIEMNLRKQVNIEVNEIEKYIDYLKKHEEEHYDLMIKELSNNIYQLRQDFEERKMLIDQDLELNLEKQNVQLESLTDFKQRKARRNVNAKIELFKLRASTVKEYEEAMLEEQINVIQKQIRLFRKQKETELLNIDKLAAFMLNDEDQLKETGTYFRELNTILQQELSTFEYSNNDYMKKHYELKSEFNRNYIKIFKELKETLVTIASMYLNQIAENNFKLDDINRFIDTAEPQKEIKVNKLREDIEINEVVERYKIKYAKEEFDQRAINDKFNSIIFVEEMSVKEQISETQLEITEIRNKEVFDKAIENAKLKQSKAEEIYKLRLNNTRLERNLLTNKYRSESDVLELQKELEAINVRKHNALISKELEFTVKSYELEANYQEEVVHKGLEETLLHLEEKVSKVQFERDTFVNNWNQDIQGDKQALHDDKQKVIDQAVEKRELVKEALERELKEPTQNKLRTETIIDERLSKLDTNNAIFVDFIRDTIEQYKDNLLSLEQVREVILSNDNLYDRSEKYIGRTYNVLSEAVEFMSDLEKHALLNKLASTTEQSKTRKLNKQIQKQEQDSEKQKTAIKTAMTDHQLVIKKSIDQELQKIKKANLEDLDNLILLTETVYYQIFDQLKSLQDNVKRETETLYQTLTKNDTEIIEFAQVNAEKAIEKINLEEKEQLIPCDKAIADFNAKKEQEKHEFIKHFDEELTELRGEINHLKNESLSKASEISNEKDELVSSVKEKRRILEENEEQEIVKRYEKIDQELQELEDNYNESLKKLETKDEEAKKIFDYEERIYNIAATNATSRYNDAKSKATNVHTQNSKSYQKQSEQSQKGIEKHQKSYNKELLKLTRQFERNIFTTRPRLEESIGDAQKAIDSELKEKRDQQQSLQNNNEKLVASAENHLFTSFSEGYDKLNNNLTTYIEKYRVIEQEFIERNNQAHDVINNNNIAFAQVLFRMSEVKHKKMLDDLKTINELIRKEEVYHG